MPPEGGLDRDIRRKIALFASLPESAVISARDVDNTYKVPLAFRAEGMDDLVLDHFGIDPPAPDLADWRTSADGPTPPRGPSGSPSSASTCNSRTPTSR
ncbi:MAG: hypothetical protein R2700_14665 [Solirubrobacterales bacterium]